MTGVRMMNRSRGGGGQYTQHPNNNHQNNPNYSNTNHYQQQQQQQQELDVNGDAKSTHSYKSTHSSRSSVLERAREYNRRLEEEKTSRDRSTGRASSEGRARSLERSPTSQAGSAAGASGFDEGSMASPRSRSAGRMIGNYGSTDSYQSRGNRVATRERAMNTVQRDTSMDDRASTTSRSQRSATNPSRPSSRGQYQQQQQQQQHHHQQQQQHHHHHQQQQQQRAPRESTATTNTAQTNNSRFTNQTASSAKSPARSRISRNNGGENPIVTPELLVDALSGHEDGLLAIAERLMEHYDRGYDVMGEAIIDAFADVQKLFQHVVEAAHMEGAAFEASRREQEIAELRQAAANGGGGDPADENLLANADSPAPPAPNPNSPGGPARHDEFIDQDVKDVLNDAVRKGAAFRESNKHVECYQLYEQACQSASALLPVDSDHRGRLQLSIARAESMSHERACAILRYAMDDVLRSGLRAGKIVPLPDPSKRADVVLTRPKSYPTNGGGGASAVGGGAPSNEEVLASLVEEMREVLTAPVYNGTPLQNVAHRFLNALNETQKSQQKNEERLEQNLGKLKGDYLLARAEWEEKLTTTQESLEYYKERYNKLKITVSKFDGQNNVSGGHSVCGESVYSHKSSSHLPRGGSGSADTSTNDSHYEAGNHATMSTPLKNLRNTANGTAGSVASLGSGLALHARNIVGSFQCAGPGNVRTASTVAEEISADQNRTIANTDAEIRQMAFRHQHQQNHYSSQDQISINRSERSGRSQTSRGKGRTFREYSRSPQRVDV